MAEEEPFKVRDRRSGRDAAPAPEPGVPSGEGTPPPPLPTSHDARSARAERPGGGASDAEPRPAGGDLRGVFVMFASSALVNLGEATDPGSGERRVDLAQAREAIDILLLLREKTRGNLSAEESRLLEELVYDLQMRFVRATTAARERSRPSDSGGSRPSPGPDDQPTVLDLDPLDHGGHGELAEPLGGPPQEVRHQARGETCLPTMRPVNLMRATLRGEPGAAGSTADRATHGDPHRGLEPGRGQVGSELGEGRALEQVAKRGPALDLEGVRVSRVMIGSRGTRADSVR